MTTETDFAMLDFIFFLNASFSLKITGTFAFFDGLHSEEMSASRTDSFLTLEEIPTAIAKNEQLTLKGLQIIQMKVEEIGLNS